ncbi:YbjQ family protein [Halorubrum sp. FL23]|uniref:YbjQ family protein n=1 Tax=Halorubrum sp. FL23 TaxID=3458704 RepID=UPI0040342ADD
MELSNTESIAGKEVTETLGLVRGNTVRARNVGRDITQGLRNLAGGELKGYTELMTDARDQAQERMIEEAESLGADGVINVRFTTSSIADSGAEILACGTAVRLR